MRSRRDPLVIVERWLVRWIDAVRRHARFVLLLEAAATLALLGLAVPELGIDMNHRKLLDPDLPFQRTAERFEKHFPTLDDALLVVVEGPTAETERRAANELAARLRARADRFDDVWVPGGDDFFQRHALLYLTPVELDAFVDELAGLQPILGSLSRDPSIANLARLIRLGLAREEERAATDWTAILHRFSDATIAVFHEYAVSISWENVLLDGSSLDGTRPRIVIVQPRLEFGRLLPAGKAITEIRHAAARLELVPERGYRVRITGNPALNHEEMLGLARDIGFSSIASFAFVTVILFLGFRSLRLVLAAATTLLFGLVWTAAFAALAVGELNVVSITFGVLFIGLGIDFAIHLGMSYVAARRVFDDDGSALESATRRTGSSLALCTVTTMIGFYAFLPTPYRGVAELGLISGTGMLIIFFQTMTCLPALITVLRPRLAAPREEPFWPSAALAGFVSRRARPILVVAAAVATTAMILLPRLGFDVNVVHLRDPGTESVQAFEDLLGQSTTSPWSIDVAIEGLPAAQRLARRLETLDEVDAAVSLPDYVPERQDEKLDILQDAALLFTVSAVSPNEVPDVPVAAQVDSLRRLHQRLDAEWLTGAEGTLAAAALRLRKELGRFLERVRRESDPQAALEELERLLLADLPEQTKRLQRALEAKRITLEALPGPLVRRMSADNGLARVQAFPRHDLGDPGALPRFVDAVRQVAPEATGVAVNLVEFGRATDASLRQALLTAFVAIAATIALLLRRVDETLLVLTPVLFAMLLTAGFLAATGGALNFANVVTLPLLLGIGVDSGIHLVHRARRAPRELLATTTARAVFYSAVTTIGSFASLAFSGHRGISSLGVLLVAGVSIILVSNLIVLPALLTARARRH